MYVLCFDFHIKTIFHKHVNAFLIDWERKLKKYVKIHVFIFISRILKESSIDFYEVVIMAGAWSNTIKVKGFNDRSIQKLSVTRLPNIVNRMRTETLSSRAKRSRFYKSDSYVDYRCYSWRNLALWSDYQAHLWKGDGSVKTSYRKWNTACKPMVLNYIVRTYIIHLYISLYHFVLQCKCLKL